MGYMTATALCCACGELFEFNPLLVPSVAIDPVIGRPPDVCECEHHVSEHVDGRCLRCDPRTRGVEHEFQGGDPARARREPVCQGCIQFINRRRRDAGQPEVEVLPGAYDAGEVEW